MHICVQATLVGEELQDVAIAPGWPVMLGENDLDFAAVSVNALCEVLGPGVRIADDSATQGQDVVEGVSGVLGSTECVEIGEPDEHFGRRLGVRCHLELHLDPIDCCLFPCAFDNHVGRVTVPVDVVCPKPAPI